MADALRHMSLRSSDACACFNACQIYVIEWHQPTQLCFARVSEVHVISGRCKRRTLQDAAGSIAEAQAHATNADSSIFLQGQRRPACS